MVKGIVIPAAGDQPVEERDFANLEDYQAAVGGWVGATDLPAIGATMLINEEGLPRQLPLNSRASFLWWYHVPEARQTPMLVGDVVLVGMPDQRGDSTDLPARIRELLLVPARYGVGVRTSGDPKWHQNEMTYSDYWEAITWAMLTLERRTDVEDVRVVPEGRN